MKLTSDQRQDLFEVQAQILKCAETLARIQAETEEACGSQFSGIVFDDSVDDLNSTSGLISYFLNRFQPESPDHE